MGSPPRTNARSRLYTGRRAPNLVRPREPFFFSKVRGGRAASPGESVESPGHSCHFEGRRNWIFG